LPKKPNKYLYEAKAFKDIDPTLLDGKIGFEREALRVYANKISSTPHPPKLGSALCNKFITTDFSEAQIEMITPAISNKDTLYEFLEDIHHYVSLNIRDEILWPFSMPPNIEYCDKIHIAKYGTSNLALFKSIYRAGLSNRYGKDMQAISGFHFNYSLPKDLWDFGPFSNYRINSQNLRADGYFNMLRNLFEMNWILIYLFGASPVLGKNLVTHDEKKFSKLDSSNYYLPFATSLRMSDFGYQNKKRSKLKISINSLDCYIQDLRRATNTLSNEFSEISKATSEDWPQLNQNILQIEDEYYATARAKSEDTSNKRTSSKLIKGGVDFIELRSLDINPFSRVGIDEETILFIESFLLYCFFKRNDYLTDGQMVRVSENDLRVSKFGRKKHLYIYKKEGKVRLNTWAKEILDEIEELMEVIGKNNNTFKSLLKRIHSKVDDPSLTLSGILMERLLSDSQNFAEIAASIGTSYKRFYERKSQQKNLNWSKINTESISSLKEQKKLELDKEISFEDYLSDYFSD